MEQNNRVKLVHYSTTSGLTELDPGMMGTGIRASESKYGIPACKYICFYREGLLTESGDIEDYSSEAKYTATLAAEQKLYDMGIDTDSIWGKCFESQKIRNWEANGQGKYVYVTSDEFKQAIKDAGYYGFYNSQHSCLGLRNAVCIFYAQSVEEDITFLERRKIDRAN